MHEVTMMPVPENNQVTDSVDYKKKYTALKRKLRFLLYEHECFLEELRKSQRKLLKVSRDKSFLLDRLLNYEKVDSSSSDSEATASSESEGEGPKEGSASKKKKVAPQPPVIVGDPSLLLGTVGFASMVQSQGKPTMGSASKPAEPARKKVKVTKKGSKPGGQTAAALLSHSVLAAAARSQIEVRPIQHMTREELERHLDMKQSSKPQFMSLEKTPNSLPDDIFSNENSNP